VNETACSPVDPAATSLSSQIARAASVLDSDSFPTGDKARLRRWAPGRGPSLAFYRFAFRHLPEDWERQRDDWCTVVAGMALAHPRGHAPGSPLGAVLAETGFAESRLERLISAEGDPLRTLVLRMTRFLAAKSRGFDWTDAARLLGMRGDPEPTRRSIARAYYRELRRQEQQQR